jgi:hypothetical protein
MNKQIKIKIIVITSLGITEFPSKPFKKLRYDENLTSDLLARSNDGFYSECKLIYKGEYRIPMSKKHNNYIIRF